MAAREVLGGEIIEHDMGGGARGGGGEGEGERIGRGRKVGTSDGGMAGFGIGAGEPGERLGIGAAVVVGENEDLAGGVGRAVVAGGGEATGFEVKDAEVFLLIKKGGGAVGGAIVDHDDFVVGVIDLAAGFEAGFEAVGSVPGADDDGEARGIFGERVGKGGFAEGFESRFFGSIPPDEPEGPIGHDLVIVEPMIRPGVEGRSGKAGGAGKFEGAGKKGRLGLFGVAVGIETKFGEINGTVAGEMVEAGEISGECFRVFEVDVEGGEVGGGRFEVFGGGEVGVSDRQAGRDFLGRADELVEGAIDFPRGHPAGHLGGDLVAHQEGPEGGVAVVGFEPANEIGPGLLKKGGVFVEKIATLAPGVGGDDE